MKKISIAFIVNGGMGTVIVRANFIQYFYNEFNDIADITIYGHDNHIINSGIFSNNNCYNTLYEKNLFKNEDINKYDVVIILDSIPNVIKSNITKDYGCIYNIIDSWKNYKTKNNNIIFYKYTRESKEYLYTNMLNKKKHIINSIDITNHFHISEEYILKINFKKDAQKVLEKFCLKDKVFYTFQIGANPKLQSRNVPKIWPYEYYEELIRMLKKKYCDVIFVQIGEHSPSSLILQNCDISLIGKTDFEDLKILLKYSTLHFDSECGMVHLRKAVHGGRSVVFFGPTLPNIFGYRSNINCRSDKCQYGCAEIHDRWEISCINIKNQNICMTSLTPQKVYKQIIQKLDCKKQVSIKDNLLLDKRFCLNSEWAEKQITKDIIYDYCIDRIILKDLKFMFFDYSKKWVFRPLIESPAYKYLQGDKEEYYKNLIFRSKYLDDNPHSENRFIALITSLEKYKYDSKNIIVIDSLNCIRDGYHRASYLLFKFGEEYEISVLKLYFKTDLNKRFKALA